jgi:hypothetical protein
MWYLFPKRPLFAGLLSYGWTTNGGWKRKYAWLDEIGQNRMRLHGASMDTQYAVTVSAKGHPKIVGIDAVFECVALCSASRVLCEAAAPNEWGATSVGTAHHDSHGNGVEK